MVANISARCVEFSDYNGDVYPGFVTLSGNYDTVSQSGLVIFNATVEIMQHPDNPQNLDTRQNFSTWAWCREVKLRVADDAGNLVIPKCLPKLYIKSAKYDPIGERLRLELTDILGIRQPITIDDFKEDFDDENVVDDAEPDRLQPCGHPEDDDYNSELAEEQDNKKKRYWWEQWEFEGWADNDEIIKELLTRLNISSTGSVQGKVKCPYTISGSLIGICGDLAFKSLTPSYLWSDWKGIVHIESIKIDQPRKYQFSVPDNAAAFESVGVGELISELIVTGRVAELDETSNEEVEVTEDGYVYKTVITEEIPSELLNIVGTTMLGLETIIQEEVKNFKKISTEATKIRYKLLFPDSYHPDYSDSAWVGSYAKEEVQWFDSCLGRLKEKRIRIWEPWGKVFQEFYSNNENIKIPADDLLSVHDEHPQPPGIAYGDQGNAGVQGYPLLDKYVPSLILSREEVISYSYDELTGKVKQIETIVREPKMKVLVSYMPASGGLIISEKHLEYWKSWGAGHHIHGRQSYKCLESKYPDLIQERENTLVNAYMDNATQEFGTVESPSIDVTAYHLTNDTTTMAFPHLDVNGKLTAYFFVEYAEKIAQRLFTAEARATLTHDRTETVHSRGGTGNAPNPEYLPNYERSESSSQSQSEKWKFKPVNWRKKWDGRQYWDCVPAREQFDVGEVYSENVLDKVGSVIFALRQAQAQTYQITIPIYETFLKGSNFKPVARWDISECWDKEFSYFGNGYGFEFSRLENLMLAELWFLGTGSVSAPDYTPPALDAFLIDFAPDPNHGVFYIGSSGPAVYAGQALTQSEIEQLVFVPGTNYTGATALTYTAQSSDGQSSPAPIAIAVIDPAIDPVAMPNDTQLAVGGENYPITGNNTGQIGVIIDGAVQYVTPSVSYTVSQDAATGSYSSIETGAVTDLESNGIVYAPSGFLDTAIQEKSVLRRLEVTPEERLGITQDTRLVSLYR